MTDIVLKMAKAPEFDNTPPEIWSEDVPRLRRAYKAKTGQDWPLTDADIVNLIAYSEDDRDDWVPAMQAYENGTILPC